MMVLSCRTNIPCGEDEDSTFCTTTLPTQLCGSVYSYMVNTYMSTSFHYKSGRFVPIDLIKIHSKCLYRVTKHTVMYTSIRVSIIDFAVLILPFFLLLCHYFLELFWRCNIICFSSYFLLSLLFALPNVPGNLRCRVWKYLKICMDYIQPQSFPHAITLKDVVFLPIPQLSPTLN